MNELVTMDKFNIGDKVIMTGPEDGMITNIVGTIICKEAYRDRWGIDFGVIRIHEHQLHNLDANIPTNTGWFVAPHRLQLVPKPINVEELI